MLSLKRVAGSVNLTRPLVLNAILVVAIVLGFSWHLASQTPGISPSEALTRDDSKLSHIVSNPLYAPYKICLNAMYHLGHGGIFYLRLTSVIFAVIFLTFFFRVLMKWFGKPIAFLSTLLFAGTPLFIVAGRTATPLILYNSVLAIIFFYTCFKQEKPKWWVLSLFVISLATALYVPGMVWLVLAAAIYKGRKLAAIKISYSRRAFALNALLLIVLLAPLVYGIANQHSLLKQWLLVPHALPEAKQFGANLFWAVSGLFYSSHWKESLNIDHLPILNAVQIGLFIFGAYVMFERLRKDFIWLVLLLVVIFSAVALNTRLTLMMMALPIIALTCGLGLRYLFVEWRHVFPLNPLAKAFAITLMFSVVVMHLFYGVRFSMIAWPATPQTRQNYVLK